MTRQQSFFNNQEIAIRSEETAAFSVINVTFLYRIINDRPIMGRRAELTDLDKSIIASQL